MDVDGRARKRRRAASDPSRTLRPHSCYSEPMPCQHFVQDPEFWFEDGSIILIACHTGFKVYRRLLMEHSPFFRDLFRIPQPAGAPKIDGCPYVVLMDRPEQLKHLLRVIFPTNGNLVFGKPHALVTMDAVAGTVRLAHKYQMDQLLAQGLSILMDYYTDDFDLWIKPDRPVSMTATDLDAISAINIAHLTKTPTILPLAFLHASRVGSAALRGCIRDRVLTEGLSFEDLERVLNGRTIFLKASSKALARITAPQASDMCADTRRCTRILAAKACELDIALEDMYTSDKVLKWASEYSKPDTSTGMRLCEKCREMIAERETDELRDLWNELPDYFDLTVEGWGA